MPARSTCLTCGRHLDSRPGRCRPPGSLRDIGCAGRGLRGLDALESRALFNGRRLAGDRRVASPTFIFATWTSLRPANMAACGRTLAAFRARPRLRHLGGSSSATHQSCTSTLATWAHGPGGQRPARSALSAGTAMGAAWKAAAAPGRRAAQGLNSAVSRADDQLPPGSARTMTPLIKSPCMTGWPARRTRGTATSRRRRPRSPTGAQVIDAVAMLQRLSPACSGACHGQWRSGPIRGAGPRRHDGGAVGCSLRRAAGAVECARGRAHPARRHACGLPPAQRRRHVLRAGRVLSRRRPRDLRRRRRR